MSSRKYATHFKKIIIKSSIFAKHIVRSNYDNYKKKYFLSEQIEFKTYSEMYSFGFRSNL